MPSPGESPLVARVGRRIPAWGGGVLLVLAGLAFFWPALRADLAFDDHVHAAMVAGTYPAPRAAYDLYSLVDDASRPALLERGVLPWWTHPGLTIRFFRPLASVLRFADCMLLGNSPLAQHVHSFLWWIAVAFAARALFRRLLSARAAALATGIFALAPCHSAPLTWLANREALVSLAFGLPALLMYLRWREARSPRMAALAALLFACALAGGEYALALTGYVLAFELVMRGAHVGRCVLGVLPFVVPTAAYLALRAALGYGSVGSGFYADPLHDPATFLRAAPARFVTLLLDAWFALDNETLAPSMSPWILAGLALGGLLLVAAALWPTLGALDEDARRHARWLLLGSTLGLAPMLAVAPSPRLLGASLLGIAAVVGLVLERAWSLGAAEQRRRLPQVATLAALALGFAHLVHGPATSWLIARGYREAGAQHARNQEALRARLGEMSDAELVVVRGGMRGPLFLPFALDPRHEPPARFSVLAQTSHALLVRRGPRTIEVIAGRNDVLVPLGDVSLFVDTRTTFAVGEVFTLPWARATVLEVAHGRPRIVQFEFDHDLDASPLVWVSETNAGFIDARPPAVGMGMPFDP